MILIGGIFEKTIGTFYCGVAYMIPAGTINWIDGILGVTNDLYYVNRIVGIMGSTQHMFMAAYN